MTIQEAIESGRRFRRFGQEGWYTNTQYGIMFSVECVLATDWEVEPLKKEISASDVQIAVTNINLDYLSDNFITEAALKQLLKNLGLE